MTNLIKRFNKFIVLSDDNKIFFIKSDDGKLQIPTYSFDESEKCIANMYIYNVPFFCKKYKNDYGENTLVIAYSSCLKGETDSYEFNEIGKFIEVRKLLPFIDKKNITISDFIKELSLKQNNSDTILKNIFMSDADYHILQMIFYHD